MPRGAVGQGVLSGGPLRLGEGQAAQQCPLPRLSLAPPPGAGQAPRSVPAQHGTKRRSRRRCLIPSAEHRPGQERKGGWGGGASAWPAVRAGGGGSGAALPVLFVPLRCENRARLLGFIDPRAARAPSRTHRHLSEDLSPGPRPRPVLWALPGPPGPPGPPGSPQRPGQRGGRQLPPAWRGADAEVEVGAGAPA